MLPAMQQSPRWHSHGWNTALSWKLILRVTPRLPGFILYPLHHLMSLVCFIWMSAERRAVRRNLQRVTGVTGFASFRLAYRLFFNFSRYMVAYARMREIDPETYRDRLLGADETEQAIRSVIDQGRGAIILTMHLGQWDLGLKLLSKFEVPVNVVMLSEEPADVVRLAEEARSSPLVKIHRMGTSRLLAVELMAALRRGEFVAVQADRAVGETTVPVEFFGAETLLPSGPAKLALATGAPVLPVFVLFEKRRMHRLLALEPMRFERERGTDDTARAMARIARMMELVASRYPDQWFNFYDVWPAPEAEVYPEPGYIQRLTDLVLKQHLGTGRLAIAVGLGVFIGLTPFYGLHTLMALAGAWVLRLNVPVTILATQVANPLFAPFWVALSVWAGAAIGRSTTASVWDPTGMEFYASWLRGGLAIGIVMGAASGLLAFVIVARARKSRSA